MHISDGILPVSVSIGTYIAAGGITAFLASKIKTDEIPKIATVTSALFIASLLHIKIGPSSAHPVFGGIGALILGPYVFIAVLVALFFQAIMFSHGGITALGANTLTVGGGALLVSLFLPFFIKKIKKTLTIKIFYLIIGFVTLLISSIMTSILLITSNYKFIESAKFIILAHIPLAMIEGIITMIVIQFISKVKPGILYQYNE